MVAAVVAAALLGVVLVSVILVNDGLMSGASDLPGVSEDMVTEDNTELPEVILNSTDPVMEALL